MDGDNVINKYYLGKMRYWKSDFSMENYKYSGNQRYKHLERKACGREKYSIIDLENIDKIRTILNSDKPINKEEQEAYDDTFEFIEFIDQNLKIIKENNYNVVFYTDYDF